MLSALPSLLTLKLDRARLSLHFALAAQPKVQSTDRRAGVVRPRHHFSVFQYRLVGEDTGGKRAQVAVAHGRCRQNHYAATSQVAHGDKIISVTLLAVGM